ncbi:MAG TPA: hypothetical protein VFA32_12505, partial [Dehalococcoidia bacterium]|nr:hypothetical protein [Dehalococcoidia bacterium]
ATVCPPGTRVEVRLDSKLVKAHPRQPRGGRSTDAEDYPAELSPYTLRAPERIKRQAVALGPTVGTFAERLLAGPLPWAKLRQGQKLLRLGERYTPARLEAACQKALDVDLIDVRRLERILTEALEEEATPVATATAPLPSRFARPGSVFAQTNGQTTLVQQPALWERSQL